jgi:NTE family protein
VLEPIRRRWRRPDKTAFVLSGGGNRGALQIGMLRALLEHRIKPDLVVGCSVGALNGAAVAADPSLGMVGRLQDLWLSLDDDDIFPAGLLPSTVQLALRGEAIHDNDGLRRVIESILPVMTFEALQVPFECVATDIDAAAEHWFSSGSLVEPLLASAAIPAVLPAVTIDGVRYLDGGIVNDVPVVRAVELGATHVYVLHVGSFGRPRPEPRRPLDVAVQAYWIARRNRFRRDLAAISGQVKVTVLPTGETPNLSYRDLTHTAELISVAYLAANDYLEGRAAPPLPVTSTPEPASRLKFLLDRVREIAGEEEHPAPADLAGEDAGETADRAGAVVQPAAPASPGESGGPLS